MKIVDLTKDIRVGTGYPCITVAEIGAMYEDIDGMKRLIFESKEAGVDMVKIQTYRAKTIALPKAEFILEDKTRISQHDFFKRYEISQDEHKTLFDYARHIGIPIFSTPSHYDDVDFLEELGVVLYKVGSDDLTNLPFLDYIARKRKPMIISTGMSNLEEVKEAVDTISKTGNEQIVILHCTTAYPPDPKSLNLKIIETLKSHFDHPIGYSDHFPGYFASVLAAGIGACIVEKHVTLDHKLKRPDHQVSIEPAELKKMVGRVRMVSTLMGESEKKVYPIEEKWRLNARKSLITNSYLKKGHVIQREDIKIMRPGTGMHPRNLGLIIGKTLKKDLGENELFTPDCV